MGNQIFPRARRHPVEIVGSDGLSRYYFKHDLEAYKAAVSSGRYPRDRTFLMDPPKRADSSD